MHIRRAVPVEQNCLRTVRHVAYVPSGRAVRGADIGAYAWCDIDWGFCAICSAYGRWTGYGGVFLRKKYWYATKEARVVFVIFIAFCRSAARRVAVLTVSCQCRVSAAKPVCTTCVSVVGLRLHACGFTKAELDRRHKWNGNNIRESTLR